MTCPLLCEVSSLFIQCKDHCSYQKARKKSKHNITLYLFSERKKKNFFLGGGGYRDKTCDLRM